MSTGIYQAITNAMSEIAPIAKGKRNKEQSFQYRGIDDVMNELNPILAKHRIFIYPEVIDIKRSERTTQRGGTLLYSVLTIKYHFATDDGSEVCAIVIGEGMDSGDKASNKAMAVAFKYACLQMFCIPTEDMNDPDHDTPPPSSQKPPEGKQGNNTPDEASLVINATGAILKTRDPAGLPCFTEAERAQEKAIAQGAANIGVLKNQNYRLKKELEKRKANYKPVPSGDTPSMYSPPEADDDGFTDDIPF